MANCVIARCGGGGALFDANGTKVIENTIFYGNVGTLGTSGLTIRNCNIPIPGGVGNFTGDPRLVDAAANDFRLLADSPCIDRGNIGAYLDCLPREMVDLAGTLRVLDDPGHANVLGAPIDVGAYEFDAGGACPGDLNHDSMVDDADFQLFLVGYNQLVCP